MSSDKSISQLYNQGDFIDAKDNQGDWRVGFIIQKHPLAQLFKVRFDGWSCKYDQSYKFTSNKLQHFRTFVIGYTGQMKNPGLRESWNFTLQNLEERTRLLQSFISNPLQYGVFQINQFMRGQNYMFSDFLMTNKFSDLLALRKVLQYFWANVELLINFLIRISENFQEFLKVIEARKEPPQNTPLQAYYLSFYELFDTLFVIFGNYERLEGFFKNNEEYLREHFKVAPNKDHKRCFKQELTRHFSNLKGIALLQQILQKLKRVEEFVPFLFLSALAHLIVGSVSICIVTFRQNVLQKLCKIGQQNVRRLKQSQLKELHRKEVSTFIEALTSFAAGTKLQTSIEQWGIYLQLNLSLKMILCPYFQRKLKGISHISEVCEKHQAFINKDNKFRVWIDQNNLFKNLFVLNDNPEIIKKSCELTRFLVIRKMLKHDDVDTIWNSRIGKHQTVLKQIYTLISELPYYEKDYAQNVKLFQKISNLPPELWDDQYVHMIRVFSTYSYTDHSKDNARENAKEILGFDIVSQYTLRKGSDTAITELATLFMYIEDSPYLVRFQENCLTQIQNQVNPKRYIRVLYKLANDDIQIFSKLKIDSLALLQNFLIHNARNEDSTMIEQTLKLIELIIKSTSTFIDANLLISLWSTLIDSPNRKVFLSWIYLADDKYVGLSPIFRKSRLAEQFLKLLWNNEHKRRTMDELEVSIAIEFVKEANCEAEKARFGTVSSNLLPYEMHGYQLLMSALKLVQQPKASLRICEFLAFLHVSVNESLLQKAITSFSQTLLAGINESIAQRNSNYLTRLLTLMKKTLDYDDELLPPRTAPKHHYSKQFTVKRDQEEELTVKFNYLGSFYQFKKLVAAKVNLPIHKFYLVNGKGYKLGRQHFAKTMVDQTFAGGKFQLFLKEEPSVIKNIFNSHIDTLFNLLDDPSIETLLWSIVERLPLSEQLKLKISRSDNIFQQLQHIGFYKQLYMLKVMQELGASQWLKFAKTNKISILLKYLQKITFNNQIEEEYAIAVTNSIMKMLNTKADIPVSQQLLPTLISLLAALFQHVNSQGSKNMEFEEKIIRNVFQIACSLPKSQNVLQRLMNHPSTIPLLNTALILLPQAELRNRFVEQFKTIIKNFDFEQDHSLVSLLLGALFASAINEKHKEHLKEYYTLTSYVLSKCSITVIDYVYKRELDGLVMRIFELLKREKSEESNQCQNKALEGYLVLLKHLVKTEKEEHQLEILNYIVYECLFSPHDTKCKSSPSRRESFNVLLELSQNERNLTSILEYLVALHKKGKWRSRRFQDWGITFTDKMKSSTGYVGIKNLGCICYMNSFIQQLFMMPSFRYCITNALDKTAGQTKPEENMMYQLQKMFMNLEHSDKKFYNPKEFCHAFKDYEGNPTNVTQQMDIDEFSNILFDRLEHQLKSTQYTTLIKDTFGGIFSNQIVCKGCPHYSQSEEPFLSISLTVKSKKTIYQGFESMIKGDNLDGDNAYYCERCNKKVNAVKRMSLKKMPNHLIITLKRFEFDYEKMIKLKVNDFCQFPHSLNLSQYSQQFLRKQEKSKAIEEEDQLDNDYFAYQLKGFVIHLGHADSGHYYSIIQDRHTGKWYEFNDSTVRDFDIDDMPEEAYGGEIGMTDLRQKIKNAYMVIYQRQKKTHEIPWKKEQMRQKAQNAEIVSEIMRENKQHKLQNILFSKEYTRYLISLLGRSEKLDYKVEKAILKFATIYYLTVTVREKAEGVNEFIIKRISRNMQKHPDLALWTVQLFSVDKIYDEFFQHNPYKEMKKLMAHWLVHLCHLCPADSRQLFLHSCLNKLVQKGENPFELCIVLYELLSNDPQLLAYAVSLNLVGKLMDNIVKLKKEKRLLPESQKDSEIGYETPVPMGLAEQIRQKKLRSIQNENQFVWATINLVIRHAQSQNKHLKDVVEQSEWQSLLRPQLKIYKIIEELRNKFAIYEFSHLLAYLTQNNEPFLNMIVDHIFTGLRDFQSKRYRQFMLLFEHIINTVDDEPHQHLSTVRLACFDKIIEALKHNEQYSLDSNIIQQWLVILLNRNQSLRAYLQKQPEILNYLLLLATKKVPSDQISRKNKKYAQSMVNKLHGVVFLCSKKAYQKQAELIKQFYQSIAEDKFVQSGLWPSVDHHLKRIAVNDKVAYFDQADKCEYEEVFVSNVFLGKVELSEGKNKIYTVWKDDQRLIAEVPPIYEQEEESLESSEKLTEQLSEDDAQIIDD